MHFEVKFEPDSKYFKTEIATAEQNRAEHRKLVLELKKKAAAKPNRRHYIKGVDIDEKK